jgi:hypothetical protein
VLRAVKVVIGDEEGNQRSGSRDFIPGGAEDVEDGGCLRRGFIPAGGYPAHGSQATLTPALPPAHFTIPVGALTPTLFPREKGNRKATSQEAA